MEIVKMDLIEGKKNTRGIIAKQLVKHKRAMVMNLILEPGDAVPEHKVPVDVFFYVVSGHGTIKIGDEEAIVKERDIVVCPLDAMMALRADQGEQFVVLNVKTPSL
jgi:quercetin dioxygenase-like cupin family protein